MVWVGPPLFASAVASPGSGDADLVAVGAVDQAARSARCRSCCRHWSRLNEPETSLAVAVLPVPAVFSATMVLFRSRRARGGIDAASRAAGGDAVIGDGCIGRR